MQVRREQVDQGREQVAPRPHQRGDSEPAGPAAPSAVNKTASLPAATHGTRLRLRAQGELLPAGSVKTWLNLVVRCA